MIVLLLGFPVTSGLATIKLNPISTIVLVMVALNDAPFDLSPFCALITCTADPLCNQTLVLPNKKKTICQNLYSPCSLLCCGYVYSSVGLIST